MLQEKNPSGLNKLSKIGLGLTYACAIHCIVSPVFLAFMPIVSSKMFHNPAIEVLLLGSSFFLIGITNLVGFINHHKQFAPMAFMFLGFSLIVSGHLSENLTLEILMALAGGVSLTYSLLLNRKAKNNTEAIQCCDHADKLGEHK